MRNTVLAELRVLQTPNFRKIVKKLKANQKSDLDQAIKELIINPLIGQSKKGDLTFLRVYKFKMARQLTLLGYNFDKASQTLELMALGSHENFYRDIKRQE